jgi:hypothetical protein
MLDVHYLTVCVSRHFLHCRFKNVLRSSLVKKNHVIHRFETLKFLRRHQMGSDKSDIHMPHGY